MTRPCRKVKHRRKLDAKLALLRTQRRDRDERRVYRCAGCSGWHLTSQPWRARE